eukprot:gnl/Hemi2/2375_TR839_c0_g1_i1.p1 gnl/Hemi2/2375_TR839_c0_g1~~gnl/Hemi2/2375_TR839_c0_g1_i1.p1  ORF type:complete len:396 (-),score=132.17 gnl/Hemi2/2375_TR839_c0_g1_i1:65-1228(-)
MARIVVAAFTLILVCCFWQHSLAVNNGLALTPQMGFNTWNHFGCGIDEQLIRNTADAMVSSGLAAAGYVYVNLDDCWQINRTADGTILEDKTKFPSGMKALADYVHSKGLKFGLYSDAGYLTCQRRPGSLGYEHQDAATYASWGVDYLKYDNCANDGTSPKVRYPKMRDALNATGRPIFFSMCEWGNEDPATWAPAVGNSWRTTGDISDQWDDMMEKVKENQPLAKYAGPGGWNDPDMLEVGNGGMTANEYTAHFTMWCLMKAPLLVGCDVTNMDNTTQFILTNSEVIAWNQDPLGVQGDLVSGNPTALTQVWAVPLQNNNIGVVLLNKDVSTQNITATWKDIGLNDGTKMKVRDVWQHSDLGVQSTQVQAPVLSHSVVAYLLSPAQ